MEAFGVFRNAEFSLELVEKARIVSLTPDNNTVVRESNLVKLTCNVAGEPSPHLHWLHNGSPVSFTKIKQEAHTCIPYICGAK